MKTQWQGQSLRLRIDEAELAQLLAGQMVENLTRWPDGRLARYQVRLTDTVSWQALDDGWQVTLDGDAVRALAARLPSREGLGVSLPVAGADDLQLNFDVDVRDSARRLKREREHGA